MAATPGVYGEKAEKAKQAVRNLYSMGVKRRKIAAAAGYMNPGTVSAILNDSIHMAEDKFERLMNFHDRMEARHRKSASNGRSVELPEMPAATATAVADPQHLETVLNHVVDIKRYITDVLVEFASLENELRRLREP